LYLLQTDLSWLGNHKGVDLLIGGVIVLGAFALWKTIPLFLHGKKEIELAEIEAKKQAMVEENNSLIRSTSDQIKNIEKAVLGNSQSISAIKNDINGKLDALNSKIKETQRILFKVSEDTQYSIFINKDGDIYERLKAFRNLIAWRKNGGIREEGFDLIRNNMKEWRLVEKLKLEVEILDQKYWDETMDLIRKSIFSGF
jgi:hypothetical protein